MTIESPEFSGEDALARIRRLIAEGGMTAVVQREQSTTMASMGGFGNNIIVSHRIHRGSQTGIGANRPPIEPSSPPSSSSDPFTSPQPSSSSQEQPDPMWGGPPVTQSPVLPQPLSLQSDAEERGLAGGQADEDSLPGPSSSILFSSSPSSSSSSSSSHSPPLPNSGNDNNCDGYRGDPYSR